MSEAEKLARRIGDLLILDAKHIGNGMVVPTVRSKEALLPFCKALLQAREALDFYADPGNYTADEDGKLIASAWQYDAIAEHASAALAAIDALLKEKA